MNLKPFQDWVKEKETRSVEITIKSNSAHGLYLGEKKAKTRIWVWDSRLLAGQHVKKVSDIDLEKVKKQKDDEREKKEKEKYFRLRKKYEKGGK